MDLAELELVAVVEPPGSLRLVAAVDNRTHTVEGIDGNSLVHNFLCQTLFLCHNLFLSSLADIPAYWPILKPFGTLGRCDTLEKHVIFFLMPVLGLHF